MSKLNPVSDVERREAADAQERAETLKFLRNPDEWPHWPRLSLKRRVTHNSETEVAVLLSQDAVLLSQDEVPPIRVWRVNLYQVIDWNKTLNYEYASFEEMLDEGKWRID